MAMRSPSRTYVIGFFSLICMGLAGCPGSIDDPKIFMKPGGSQTTMSSCAMGVDKVESEILAKKCGTAGCHDSAGTSNNLNLATPGVAGRIVGHPAMSCPSQSLITAGDPTKSFLFAK